MYKFMGSGQKIRKEGGKRKLIIFNTFAMEKERKSGC
jgi:hypothetical protein